MANEFALAKIILLIILGYEFLGFSDRALWITSFLTEAASGVQYPWEGNCGIPATPVWAYSPAAERTNWWTVQSLLIDHGTPNTPKEIARLNPWTIFLKDKSNMRDNTATLIRAKVGEAKSDLAITNGETCNRISRLSNKPDAYFGAYEYQLHKFLNRVGIDDCYKHPGYDFSASNDIGIIKFTEPVDFTTLIQPACLPNPNEPVNIGVPGIAAGFGYVESSSSDNDPLRLFLLRAVHRTQCSHLRGVTTTDDWFCIDERVNTGTSMYGYDDCGGPFLTGSDGRFFVTGVLGCHKNGKWHPRLPNIAARVSAHINWLREMIPQKSSLYNRG